MKTKTKRRMIAKMTKKKKEDYGSKRLPNTLEEMMLMPHKLTQPKVLKKTLIQKELQVMMMEKTMKKAVTKKKMMLKVMKTKLRKKKKRREGYGLRKSLNISEEMMLLPHKLTQLK